MYRFLKTAAMLVSVSFLFSAFIGCGAPIKKKTGSADDAGSLYPKVIEDLLEKKYNQSIKAVGLGTDPDRVTAAKKARLDAENQIANVFRNDLSALQKSFLEAVNQEHLEEYRNTVESFTNIQLQGVSEAKATVSEGKDGYTAYILMTVSAETLKNLIDQKTSALTNFKALKAYKELEDRVAKDNAARSTAEPE
jgi:hypothetical protein